jgi:hypothetical protein
MLTRRPASLDTVAWSGELDTVSNLFENYPNLFANGQKKKRITYMHT